MNHIRRFTTSYPSFGVMFLVVLKPWAVIVRGFYIIQEYRAVKYSEAIAIFLNLKSIHIDLPLVNA